MKVSRFLSAGFALALCGSAFGQVSSVAPSYTGDENNSISQDEFMWDDGTTENLLGWTAGGTMAFIQWFDAGAGATLSEVRIINGSALYPGYGNGNGSPVSVGVWSDPNGDGNPTDSVLLTSVDTTVQNIDTDTYQTVAISPTNVTGKFFVGAWIAHVPGKYVAPMDQSSSNLTANRAYVFGGTTFNQNTPGSGNQYLYEMFSIGFPTNFCVRASTGAAFSLAKSAGTCPGAMTYKASGASAGDNVALVFAASTGNFTIPSGACAGTQLGLGSAGIQLVGTTSANGAGVATFSGNAPPAACNRFLQAVNLNGCATSNVVQVN